MELLEKVQRRAVMMVTNIKGNYMERLAILGMRTLEDRRLRGDAIETYNILTGHNDVMYQSWFRLAREQIGAASTRAMTGHLNLVMPPPAKSELRRNFFSYRAVPHWNQLPDHVKSAQNIQQFKILYDEHTGY